MCLLDDHARPIRRYGFRRGVCGAACASKVNNRICDADVRPGETGDERRGDDEVEETHLVSRLGGEEASFRQRPSKDERGN